MVCTAVSRRGSIPRASVQSPLPSAPRHDKGRRSDAMGERDEEVDPRRYRAAAPVACVRGGRGYEDEPVVTAATDVGLHSAAGIVETFPDSEDGTAFQPRKAYAERSLLHQSGERIKRRRSGKHRHARSGAMPRDIPVRYVGLAQASRKPDRLSRCEPRGFEPPPASECRTRAIR